MQVMIWIYLKRNLRKDLQNSKKQGIRVSEKSRKRKNKENKSGYGSMAQRITGCQGAPGK